jgi:hypothetical protein
LVVRHLSIVVITNGEVVEPSVPRRGRSLDHPSSAITMIGDTVCTAERDTNAHGSTLVPRPHMGPGSVNQ